MSILSPFPTMTNLELWGMFFATLHRLLLHTGNKHETLQVLKIQDQRWKTNLAQPVESSRKNNRFPSLTHWLTKIFASGVTFQRLETLRLYLFPPFCHAVAKLAIWSGATSISLPENKLEGLAWSMRFGSGNCVEKSMILKHMPSRSLTTLPYEKWWDWKTILSEVGMVYFQGRTVKLPGDSGLVSI